MSNQKIAREILPLLGGEENVKDVTHCVTRLRLTLKDNEKADKAGIQAIQGVMGATVNGGQFQIIVGDKVSDVHSEFIKLLGNRQVADDSSSASGSKGFKGILNSFFNVISSIFAPIIPAIIGAGLLKGIITLLSSFELVSLESSTYKLLSVFADAAFYFLPVLLAFSTAKKFNANQYVAGAIAGVLIHPNLGALLNGESPVTLLGIPITSVIYASSVLPIILGVWFMSYVEKILKRIIPKVLQSIFLPLLTLLIVSSIILIALGPAGTLIGNGIAVGFISLYMNYGWLAGLLLGGFYPLIVITGMHYGFLPVMFQSLSKYGVDFIMGIAVAANSGQAGATLAVYLKTKNKEFKAVAGTAALNAIIGITEPALYGVTVKLKKPLIAAAIAGGLGSAVMGWFKVGATGIGTGPIAGLPFFFGSTFLYFLIGCAVSFVVGFVLTLIIGFEDIPERKEAVAVSSNNTITGTIESDPRAPVTVQFNNLDRVQPILSPIHGEVVELSQVSDPAFAAGMMGKGIAIRPTTGRAVSPVKGTVATVFKKKHAIVVVADSGAEILIHIGIDTVKLNGQHFETHVEVGQHVEAGDLLVEFDIEQIKKAGYDTVTPIIVANYNDYVDVNAESIGSIDEKDPLMKVIG
ncbi:beta-glucoside-specific PTS transporter subunit IIABC [Paenibacillus sp. FSL M7-0134]|uniref:beta-glucoside-specific PTS transporter subunit IIABC n=1 Tax=Paenibacillus sp. FSL M7-0134 TaxID=2954754 RepID=UPI0030F805A7